MCITVIETMYPVIYFRKGTRGTLTLVLCVTVRRVRSPATNDLVPCVHTALTARSPRGSVVVSVLKVGIYIPPVIGV